MHCCYYGGYLSIERRRFCIAYVSIYPTILHLYIQPEKTMKHFVVLQFQKVNMCRDGLSLSLSPSFFYMSSWIRVCTYVWCLSGWFVCLIDRESERGKEKDFVVTKRLAIRRRTYCFVATHTAQVEKCQWTYMCEERGREKSQIYRTEWSRIAAIDVYI